MPWQWNVVPQRYAHMVTKGLPAGQVDQGRGAVSDRSFARCSTVTPTRRCS
ncbi:hypothetical protein GCM10022403_092360 [Streptomyces coacervatus]|uniref:Uncharacterized protein n=1 Tax=Streptomyces coacervatus TaxID=647381 RepID=A0ABP7JJ11_9ACTN